MYSMVLCIEAGALLICTTPEIDSFPVPKALFTLAGSVRRRNTVSITCSNTQGGKESEARTLWLSGNTASEARENLNS